MCGRYSLVTSVEKIKKQLGEAIIVPPELPLNYNIAPTQSSLVLTNQAPDRLQVYRWGLVPHWSKDTQHAARLINARREHIATKPSFRIPIRKRRCLVLADSFYEWRKEGGQKIPYRIRLANEELLLFAGIWDTWRHGDGSSLHTYSIITTDPNREMEGIHSRMPVILNSPEQQGKWLADIELEEALELLQTPPDGILQFYRVSQRVNSVRNNGPALHEPVTDEPLTLF